MAVLSDGNARLASARRLTSRRDRRETGLFLAEGAPAVREALAAGAVVELFATAEAHERHADLLTAHTVSEISLKAAATLSETATPQGLIAVCHISTATLDDVLAARPRLVVMLVEPNEPGNLGAIIRTADAAGAAAVVVDGGADPYGGKAVRASAGSLFHLPVVAGSVNDLRTRGLRTVATSGEGALDLDDLIDDGRLADPTAWLFGNEARGLPAAVQAEADLVVRIPIHGRAESLNLAAAAAVCLYASARAQRR